MKKVQKIYTAEFKREAVRLACRSSAPIAQVARELGISDTSIHQWRKELAAHGDDAFPGSGHQTAQEEWLNMREAVVYAFAFLRVKGVFVDEAQHLMPVDTPYKPTSQLDWLIALTNRTNVLQVLASNFDLYDFCHLHGQADRRMRDLYFPRSHFDNATECEEFVGALRSLLEQVPLTVDMPGLLTHWRWFGEWTLWCVGVLSDWLVETVDALYKQGETTLTIDALQKHALPPDLLARMEREAHTGEFKMEQAKTQSEQELLQLLGNPAPVPGTAPTPARFLANGANASKLSPDANLHTQGQTRVERAAARDSVGDQVQKLISPKCTFSGVVPIEIKCFLDSGVALVECPNCARARTLEPCSKVLRFPFHDKRKTHTPNTEQRWAMGKMTWEVVGGERM